MKNPFAVEIDRERYEVRVKGRLVELAPKEYDVLITLEAAGGRVMSREAIFEKVWTRRRAQFSSSRTVDQHIARLRRKIRRIKGAPDLIKTVTLRGYRWFR